MTNPFSRGRGNRAPEPIITATVGDETIRITGEALKTLNDLATEQGVSLMEVLAEAIAIQKAITEERARGGRVIVQRDNEKPRELVLATR